MVDFVADKFRVRFEAVSFVGREVLRQIANHARVKPHTTTSGQPDLPTTARQGMRVCNDERAHHHGGRITTSHVLNHSRDRVRNVVQEPNCRHLLGIVVYGRDLRRAIAVPSESRLEFPRYEWPRSNGVSVVCAPWRLQDCDERSG